MWWESWTVGGVQAPVSAAECQQWRETKGKIIVSSREWLPSLPLFSANKAPFTICISFASGKPMYNHLFNWVFSSWYLPDSIVSSVLVPIIKDKAGKINSCENYWPIALAGILSKILERTFLNRLEQFVLTSDNQFGFKPRHGTNMCVFSLKDILDLYNRHNSTMSVFYRCLWSFWSCEPWETIL